MTERFCVITLCVMRKSKMSVLMAKVRAGQKLRGADKKKVVALAAKARRAKKKNS